MAARLAVATLLGAAVPLILPGAGQAAAATVTCTSNTHVFDVRGNGDLWLYDHTAPTTGAFTWANVHMIGAGFTGTILGGAGGDIYRITADGTLRLYNFSNGGWTNAGGTAIGSGFQMFAPNMITSDSAGRIYAANQFGELFMYHYDKATRTWDDGAGTPMDLGWNFFAQNGYVQITAAGDGVVYAVDKAGALFRYRYDPHSQRWTEYGRRVGAGFDGPIFSPGGDVLYLRNLNAGTINWYHFNDDTGTWDNGGGGRLVGAGFDWSNHPYVTSGTDTCAGPTPAPVAAVTPVPAPADAPIAMTSDLDGVTHMFYPDQAGHVVEAIPANGTSVLTRQFDTIVTTAPISAANAAVAVLDSAGQVWINRSVSGGFIPSFTSLGGYFTAVRIVPSDGLVSGAVDLVGADGTGALWERQVDSSQKLFPWRAIGITLASGTGMPDLSTASWAAGGYDVGKTANGNAQFVYFAALPPSTGRSTSLPVSTYEVLGVTQELVDFPTVFAYDSAAGQAYFRTVTNKPTDAWQPLPPLALAANEPVSAVGTFSTFTNETAVAAVGADGFVYVTSNYSGADATYVPWRKVSTQPAATPPTWLGDDGAAHVTLVFRGKDGQLYRYTAPETTTQAPLSFTGGPLQPF